MIPYFHFSTSVNQQVDDKNCFITTNTCSRTNIFKRRRSYITCITCSWWLCIDFLSIIYYYITFLSTLFTTMCLFAFVAELNRSCFEFGNHASAATSSVMKLLASDRLISYCACACVKCGVSVCRRLCCVWSVDTGFYKGSVKFRLG